MKTKTRKPLVALSLLAAIALTGCAGDKLTPENAPTPTVATQAAKTAEPTATAIELPEGKPLESIDPTAVQTADPDREMSDLDEEMREGKNTAKSIDLDHIVENWTDDEVFTYYDKTEVKEGIDHGLGVYYDLTQMRNFYVKRDATKDFDLVNNELFADRIDRGVMAEMEEVTAKNGAFSHIKTAPGNTEVGTLPNGDKLSITNSPTFTFNDPQVYASRTDRLGTFLVIEGRYDIHWEFTGGYQGTTPYEYWIGVKPSDGQWSVVSLAGDPGATKVTKDGKPVDMGGGK